MKPIRVLTIGFTQTTAKAFFEVLKRARVSSVIDVRLNNQSQLAGFAKKDDLQYFLDSLGGIKYRHELQLAPTAAMLDAYKKRKGEWGIYEGEFRTLLASRKIETLYKREDFDCACLLCSEHRPHNCHRRLVAEYLNEKWGSVDIEHLVPEGGRDEAYRHRSNSI